MPAKAKGLGQIIPVLNLPIKGYEAFPNYQNNNAKGSPDEQIAPMFVPALVIEEKFQSCK
jgi:hypothetical protein